MSQSGSVSVRRATDCRTQMALPSFAVAVAVEDVFKRVFLALDPLYRSFPGDGLLVAAVFGGYVIESYLHVALPPLERERPEFVVLGRHSQCDLRLASDSSISLRHLVISACRQGGELRVRLSDLGTETGITTEDGQRCEGLAAEGAAFVTVGAYQLFLLPTGALAPIAWGGTAEEAWAGIPDRVYADRRSSRSHTPARRVQLVEPVDRRAIATQIIDPPTALRERRPDAGARGPMIGTLTLETVYAREVYEVHDVDLARGVLIGRYDRCAFGSADERLSRVHLLLVRDGAGVWAVDTASSNGTTNGVTGRIRQLALGEAAELSLGRAITLTWGAISGPPPEAEA
jgi:hypothetical protein